MLKVAHKRRIQDSIVLEDSCADLCVRKLPYSVYVLFHLGTRSLVSPLMRMMLAALFCNALDKFDAANAGTLWCTCPGPQCKHNVRAVVQCGSSRSLPDALSLCPESALQEILPQVLLGNEHQLSVRTLRTLRPSLPNNLHIWREKSAWTNTGLIKRYLSLLARSLGNVVEKRTALVLMDMNPSHLDYSLIAHARRLSLRLVLVPAKMTKWLQPADVALFNKLKKSFRAKWCEVKSTSPQGTVSQEQWLHLICSAVQEVLLGFCWRAVFASTGLLGSQEAISESLCQELGLDTPPQVPERSPTRSEAVVLFPARTKVEVLAWIHFCPKSKVPLCCPPPVSYFRGQAVRRLE